MAAKVTTRKTTKIDNDYEPYVVIDEKTRRRVYLGAGVPQDQAEELAASLARPARAVALAELDAHGRLAEADAEQAQAEETQPEEAPAA